QGVVEACNNYKRPLLAEEAAQETSSEFENNEYWATVNSVTAATNQCGTGQGPGQLLLDTRYQAQSGNAMETTYGWPT
ncbi:adhesion domain-containing protein, partial [Salmonella enterica subsp. enterica serovar Infantis]